MRLSEHRFVFAFTVGLTLGLAACGGGDDSSDIDAGAQRDAPVGNVDASSGNGDGMQPTGSAIGQSCTGAPGQGDCPAGYECLNLQGGSGAWCSKRCQSPNDPVCAEGYDGPGLASCFLTIDPNDGNPAFMACGVFCNDPPGAPDICSTCDGTCPGTLQCVGDVTDQNGNVVANSCD